MEERGFTRSLSTVAYIITSARVMMEEVAMTERRFRLEDVNKN
jgi:hypothetical protein